MTQTVTETWVQMLELRINELEQRNNMLLDKLEQLTDGCITHCVNPGCSRYLGSRLALGYCTCSDSCTLEIQRLHPTAMHERTRYLAKLERERDRRRQLRLVARQSEPSI